MSLQCLDWVVLTVVITELSHSEVVSRLESGPESTPVAEDLVTLAEVERRYVDHVLRVVGGNKSRAAKVLGIDRRTLYRLIAA